MYKFIAGVLVYIIMSMLSGCSSFNNINHIKHLNKLQFNDGYSPYSQPEDSIMIPAGTYFACYNDSILPGFYVVLEKNGTCWNNPRNSGIWKVDGDTVRIQFYAAGWPDGVIFQRWDMDYRTYLVPQKGVLKQIKSFECFSSGYTIEKDSLTQSTSNPDLHYAPSALTSYKSKWIYDMRKKKWMWTNSRDYKEWKKQGDHSW